MISSDVRIAESGWMPLRTGLDPERHVYVIGDVHGRSDALSVLLDHLERRLGHSRGDVLIFLGDLHDRGADGLGAIDLALDAPERGFGEVVHLMGNHEQLARLAMRGRDDDALELWIMNGGGKVLDQLGIDKGYRETSIEFGRRLSKAFGRRRTDWYESLSSHARFGNLLFVHAGIRHDVPHQRFLLTRWDVLDEMHWAWIRWEFLCQPVTEPGLTVVHGHTMARIRPLWGPPEQAFEPHLARDGKINLDGGSFSTGCVAAAEFKQDSWRLFVAVAPPSR